MIFEFILLVKAEWRREYIFMKRYPFEILSWIFFMYVVLMAIFLGISQLSHGDGLDIDQNRMILGYCLMQFVMSAQMGWAGQISNESQTGTLEQLSISGHRLGTVLLARGFAQFPRQIANFFILLSAYSYTVPGISLNVSHFYRIIPFLFLIVFGVYGIAYLFAGLTLIFKRIGFFFQVINFGFLGLFWQNREQMADGSLNAVLYDLFPLTLGMKHLTQLFLGDSVNVVSIVVSQSVASGIFGLSGYLLFVYMEKRARDMALLSQY